MRDDKENLIINKTIQFSINIIKFCEKLEEHKKYVVARQLLRAGTSVGANVFEAQNAESRADFIHKMKIAAKEAEETEYWLLLCQEAKSYPTPKELISTIESIHKILTKIISSTKRQSSNPQIN